MPKSATFERDQKIQSAAFAAGLTFCLERADSNDKQSFVGVRIFHSVAMRPACILVVVQTSHCSFSHTRIPSAYACGYPRSCSNFALLVFTYSDSPRPENLPCCKSGGVLYKCGIDSLFFCIIMDSQGKKVLCYGNEHGHFL